MTSYQNQPEGLEGELLPATEGSGSERPTYFHVFGGPLQGKRRGRNNFVTFTAGPVPKAADDEVTSTQMQGEHGETFAYLGTFTHDPTEQDLTDLKPEAFR